MWQRFRYQMLTETQKSTQTVNKRITQKNTKKMITWSNTQKEEVVLPAVTAEGIKVAKTQN